MSLKPDHSNILDLDSYHSCLYKSVEQLASPALMSDQDKRRPHREYEILIFSQNEYILDIIMKDMGPLDMTDCVPSIITHFKV